MPEMPAPTTSTLKCSVTLSSDMLCSLQSRPDRAGECVPGGGAGGRDPGGVQESVSEAGAGQVLHGNAGLTQQFRVAGSLRAQHIVLGGRDNGGRQPGQVLG